MLIFGWGIGILSPRFARCGSANAPPERLALRSFPPVRIPNSSSDKIKEATAQCQLLPLFGWGIGIRTPTGRVRVCSATFTQFPNILFWWATDIHYTRLVLKVNTILKNNFAVTAKSFCRSRICRNAPPCG